MSNVVGGSAAGSGVHRRSVESERGARDVRAALVEVGRRWASSQRELLGLVVELDRSGAWALDGSRTCAHWVAGVLDIEVCTAREWLRVGHALAGLGVIAAAFDDGRLSYSKVRTLTRVATEATEAELCAIAERTPAGQLATVVAAWLAGREEPAETEERQRKARCLSFRTEPDGMVIGWFRLPPLEAGRLIAAVDAWVLRRTSRSRAQRGGRASADASRSPSVGEARELGEGSGWPSVAQQRADALVELVTNGGAGVVTEVVVHVRGDGCSLDDGTPVPGSVVERIAPGSFLRALIHDAERRPINASGRHRHPTARQQRVVHERDRRCVDCGETAFLEYDHDPPFEVSRRTVIDELAPRCWTCHRARHRGGSRL